MFSVGYTSSWHRHAYTVKGYDVFLEKKNQYYIGKLDE